LERTEQGTMMNSGHKKTIKHHRYIIEIKYNSVFNMTAMRKSKLRRRNGRSKKSTAVFILVSSLLGLCLLLTLVSHFWLSSSNTDGSGSTLNLHRLNGGNAKKIHNDIGNGNAKAKATATATVKVTVNS